MKTIYFLFIVICLSSCSTTNMVNNGRLIQKRKYNKGWFVSMGLTRQTNSSSLDKSYTDVNSRPLAHNDIKDKIIPILADDTSQKRIPADYQKQKIQSTSIIKKSDPKFVPYLLRGQDAPTNTEVNSDKQATSHPKGPITTRQDHRRVGWWTIITAFVLNIIGLFLWESIELGIISFWVFGIVLLVIGIILLLYKHENRNPKWPTAKIWLIIGLGIIGVVGILAPLISGYIGSMLLGLFLASPAVLISLFYFISVRISK